MQVYFRKGTTKKAHRMFYLYFCQVSNSVGNTSLRASLRRMEHCLADRGGGGGSGGEGSGGGGGDRRGSSSSLGDRQSRIFDRRSFTDRSTSESHLTSLSRVTADNRPTTVRSFNQIKS